MNPMKEFFELERKRVFKPDVYFTHRVMARLDQNRREGSTAEMGFWDVVPGSTRPVLALALMLILCFIAVEMFVPQLPQHGMVESFLAPDQNPAESFLYNDTDVTSPQVVLEQVIALEEQ